MRWWRGTAGSWRSSEDAVELGDDAAGVIGGQRGVERQRQRARVVVIGAGARPAELVGAAPCVQPVVEQRDVVDLRADVGGGQCLHDARACGGEPLEVDRDGEQVVRGPVSYTHL